MTSDAYTPAGVDLVKLRVLVVDDSGTMRKIVSRLLRQVGITEVDEAANGEAALRRLRSPRLDDPDVIISDLHMDGVDGLQLCNTIRRDKKIRNRAIPVVILTGDSDDLIHEVGLQLGATEILVKPVSAQQLLESIQTAIGFTA